MTVLIILSLLLAVWLTFMLICPNRWSAMVDKENNFWVQKGVLKPATAERFANFEKGIWLKILVAIAMLAFLANAWLSTL